MHLDICNLVCYFGKVIWRVEIMKARLFSKIVIEVSVDRGVRSDAFESYSFVLGDEDLPDQVSGLVTHSRFVWKSEIERAD